MPSIAERLIAKLKSRFPHRPMRLGGDESAAVTFVAAHTDFGDIEIHDDGHELTVVFGRFTHSHVGNYDEGINESERAERIADQCVCLLDDVFAERVEFFGSHQEGGGFGPRGEIRRYVGPKGPLFVWSGPLSK
jgi:hypothetical protein